jgi:hypothetical protein
VIRKRRGTEIFRIGRHALPPRASTTPNYFPAAGLHSNR